jgi:hypothetical protein
MSSKPIHVSLAVLRVGSGGNTRDGQYFYSFTPAIIDVTEPDTEVIFSLSNDVPVHYQLVDIFVNGLPGSVRDKHVSGNKRSLSIISENKVQQLVFVSLLVMDGETRVNCDPQMTNTPKV